MFVSLLSRPAPTYSGGMNDAALNPYTGDYTGERIKTLANAVYIRLFTPLGSWWADPALGSRLHELQREKDLSRVRVLARQYAETALRPLVTSRRAKSVRVEAVSPSKDQSGGGRCLLIIEVEDATGTSQTYQFPVKVI